MKNQQHQAQKCALGTNFSSCRLLGLHITAIMLRADFGRMDVSSPKF